MNPGTRPAALPERHVHSQGPSDTDAALDRSIPPNGPELA
jgi:hypothetical protein